MRLQAAWLLRYRYLLTVQCITRGGDATDVFHYKKQRSSRAVLSEQGVLALEAVSAAFPPEKLQALQKARASPDQPPIDEISMLRKGKCWVSPVCGLALPAMDTHTKVVNDAWWKMHLASCETTEHGAGPEAFEKLNDATAEYKQLVQAETHLQVIPPPPCPAVQRCTAPTQSNPLLSYPTPPEGGGQCRRRQRHRRR